MIKATIYVATFLLSLVSFLGVPPVPILSPLSYILYDGGDNNDFPPLLLSVTIIMLILLLVVAMTMLRMVMVAAMMIMIFPRFSTTASLAAGSTPSSAPT